MSNARAIKFKTIIGKLISDIKANVDIKKEENVIITFINETNDIQAAHEMSSYIRTLMREEITDIADDISEEGLRKFAVGGMIGMLAGGGLGFFVQSNIPFFLGTAIGAGYTFYTQPHIKTSPLLVCLTKISIELDKRETALVHQQPRLLSR